jgi:threonine dehydrogenase-like Zn-dependent dehydrogenase
MSQRPHARTFDESTRIVDNSGATSLLSQSDTASIAKPKKRAPTGEARDTRAPTAVRSDSVRAVVCTEGGTEVATVTDPTPARDEVVVAVDACGLCGSDVHAIERGETADGQILGHEFAGTIVALGADVTGWAVGRPVAVNPLGSCGHCRSCRKDLPFRCEARPNLGITAPGGYAEYVAVPQAQLVGLPDGMALEQGAHAEPLAVAMNAVRLADPGPGDAALVFGIGPIGLNAILALRLAGVEHIVAAGRSAGRRAVAQELGADVVLDTRETDVGSYVESSGRRFAAALECSAAPDAMAECIAVLEPGGVCVEVALNPATVPLAMGHLVDLGLTVSGSCAYSNHIYDKAVAEVVSGRVPVASLISERVGLDATPDALLRLRTPGHLVRVLIRPSLTT